METVTEILSDGGALSEYIKDFKSRKEQQEMAEAISLAINNNESVMCEAGTGTGKTFAYLVPALLSGSKVIISTGTKHLQDQLFTKDLPVIRKALGLPINISLLKGRANYLCLQRLGEAEEDRSGFAKKNLSHLFHIRQWSTQTSSGDLAELTNIPEDASVRYSIVSTTENCLNQECDHFENCFVFKARKLASDADVIVVNHHLFLADMALKETGYGELLPGIDTIVFDEAHKIPDLASQFFSRTLSARQLLELITDSKNAYYKEAADLPEFLEILDKQEKALRDLRLSFGRSDVRTAWHDLSGKKEVDASLNELIKRCHDLHQLLDEFSNRGKELENCFKRLNNMLDLLDDFMEGSSDKNIKWLETRGQGFFLHQTPLDIAHSFQNNLADYSCNVIYTSATLSANKTFSHFAGQMGLDNVEARSWESPFNFMQQALCYLPEGLPDPRAQDYTERVVEKVLPVLQTTQGRAFFLFTSYRAMNIAAEILENKLDYPLLIQGEAPRAELLEKFREHHHSILLGTSSFWEGVDVRGQSLSCVIIDKLPFAAPDDPVLKARMRKMEEEGKNPFMEYQVPEAVITLKQGIGRLIRDPNDYGLLMLCDPRIRTKSYGKIFLRSLPEMRKTTFVEDVEIFFDEKEGALGQN